MELKSCEPGVKGCRIIPPVALQEKETATGGQERSACPVHEMEGALISAGYALDPGPGSTGRLPFERLMVFQGPGALPEDMTHPLCLFPGSIPNVLHKIAPDPVPSPLLTQPCFP
jgi:hypothetical protein